MQINELIEGIAPADKKADEACRARWDMVAKPLGSLGSLEDMIIKTAAVTGSADIDIGRKCVLVFCADNGVVAQNVTQCGSEVTTNIARSLAAATASVNVMARCCGADVFAIDMGMVDTVSGLIPHKLAFGTNDISKGPAMTREVAEKAVLTGAKLIEQKKREGYKLIATGEGGIGNTTTSSAVAAALLGLSAEKVTGRGSGLSDDGLMRKIETVKKALKVNKPNAADPIDVLCKVGGFDIAAMTGAFLGGAYHRVPVVMDGLISSAAALCAARLCPDVKEYILPSHLSAEPAGRLIMQELGLSPIIDASMRLGEGTGAVALFPLLDMAAAVYKSAATFNDLKMDAYKR